MYEKLFTKELLEAEYKEIGSIVGIARKYGSSRDTVRTYMNLHSVEHYIPPTYTCDDDFFSRDNEKSFYIAGFLAADGYIYEKRNVVSIGLSSKDLSLLEKIKKELSADNKIHRYVIKNSRANKNWNDTEKVEIRITSKKMVDDLKRFNVVNAKTHTYKMPDWLLEHELLNHFLRGYNDGDGCFSLSLGKGKVTPQYYNSIRGTKKFLSQMESIFRREVGSNYKEPRPNCGIYTLEYGGNGIFRKIFEYLYKDATLMLDRKYNKGLEVYEYELAFKVEDVLTKESLEESYKRTSSMTETAEEFGISTMSIHKYLHKYGIEVAEHTGYKAERFKTLLSKENLQKSLNKTMSIRKSAEELGVGKTTIRRYMKRHGIENVNSKIQQK